MIRINAMASSMAIFFIFLFTGSSMDMELQSCVGKSGDLEEEIGIIFWAKVVRRDGLLQNYIKSWPYAIIIIIVLFWLKMIDKMLSSGQLRNLYKYKNN